MNSKDYRDTVLIYVEKLGEIDRIEDQIISSQGETHKLKQELLELKKEVNNLKLQIDSYKKTK